MQKIIDQITDNLAGLVTSDKPVYSPKELLKAKIPSFVVERIRMALEDKVREELGKLSTDWFDFSSRLVSDAWLDFERAALGSSQIPRENLYTILSSVVSDIVHVFIEPRKNMANYIFRDDDELSLKELEHRCSRLTVYKHFGTAIPLYMKKRQLETLSKERCMLLIQKIDAKLVAAYKAEDWAQKLEQLFVLFGGEVDPKLLAIFFEDKGLPAMAKKFSSKRKLITKANFITIISSKEIETVPEDDPENQSLVESFFGTHPEDPINSPLFDETLAEQFLEGGLSDEEMTELLQDIASDGVVEVDHEHVASLNELFQSDAEIEDDSISETSEEIAEKIKHQKDSDPEEIKEFRENLISILDQAKHSFEGVTHDEDESEPSKEEQPKLSIQLDEDNLMDEQIEETISEGNDTVEEADSVQQPMWAKFLNSDQMDVMMGGKRSDDRIIQPNAESEDNSDIEVDEIFDESIIDEPVQTEKSASVVIAEFNDILEDRKAEFVEVIFKSDEKMFDDSLSTLSEISEWKDASAFIKNEIFAKNDVDLFSGATVDFTDRMHRYFNEQKNS